MGGIREVYEKDGVLVWQSTRKRRAMVKGSLAGAGNPLKYFPFWMVVSDMIYVCLCFK